MKITTAPMELIRGERQSVVGKDTDDDGRSNRRILGSFYALSESPQV